jgi:3-phenylpropionate/trans-cinnamate dioxygenase ferredoxin subunit
MDADDQRFVVVAKLADLSDGGLLRVTLEDHALVLARQNDTVYAFQRTCPHEKADLAHGRIGNGRLVCARHLASFNLADGQASSGWKLDALKLYPVLVQDGEIAIDAAAVRRNPPAGERKVWDFTSR